MWKYYRNYLLPHITSTSLPWKLLDEVSVSVNGDVRFTGIVTMVTDDINPYFTNREYLVTEGNDTCHVQVVGNQILLLVIDRVSRRGGYTHNVRIQGTT